MSFDPGPAAAALLAARRDRRPAGPLDAGIAPATEAEGILVQHALAELFGALPPAGFKIGATAQVMRDYLGLPGPIVGFMAEPGLHPSGAEMPLGGLRSFGVECEIGVRVAHDMAIGPCSPADAREAVAELFAAIELVEDRYAGPAGLREIGAATLVADQVFHAGAVLGDAGDWQALDLPAMAGRLTVDGQDRGGGHGRDLLGDPLAAFAWLAGSDAVAAFGGLRAGQVCMLGSVIAGIWLDRPCEVVVTFEGLPPARLRVT